MNKIALFGAGKIGSTITSFLSGSGRYHVSVADLNEERAQQVAAGKNAKGFRLNLNSKDETKKLLTGVQAVISALPFHLNAIVAELARDLGIHYLDLTEDVKNTAIVKELARGASSAFLPQCGLAPGFISIAAASLIHDFEKIDSIKMRVGALPIFPSNAFKYNLSWSTEGLINEYAQLCEVVLDGKKQLVQPLEGLERFSLDGSEYEAFNTSGGLGTLAETLEGKVKSLNYKSIRYPGHREIVYFLMNDLKFKDNQPELCKILDNAIPATKQDKVIIFVEVTGTEKGRLMQKTFVKTVYNQDLYGEHFGAIQVTTASGICAPLDLLLSGKLKQSNELIKLEDIPMDVFLQNEFGKVYGS